MPNTTRFLLLVDDDPYIVSEFTRALEGQEGYLLDIAMTVELALKKIEVTTYDLIFLDMKLGHQYAGMDVLRELSRQKVRARARQQPMLDTRVVIMSASVPLQDVMREAHDLGVFTFVDKPIPLTGAFIKEVIQYFGLPVLPKRSGLENP